MANDPNISILLDIYGDVLTKKQKICLDLYYNQDLSLSEIAEICNITRQGVRDFIEKGKTSLFELEDQIKIINNTKNLKEDILKIIDLSTKILDYNNYYYEQKIISKYAASIKELAEDIYNSY